MKNRSNPALRVILGLIQLVCSKHPLRDWRVGFRDTFRLKSAKRKAGFVIVRGCEPETSDAT